MVNNRGPSNILVSFDQVSRVWSDFEKNIKNKWKPWQMDNLLTGATVPLQGLARNFLLGFLNISFFLGLEKNISISFFLWEIFRLEIQIFLSFSEIKKYFRKFLFISQKKWNEKYLRKKYFLISFCSKNRHRFTKGVKSSLISDSLSLPEWYCHTSERVHPERVPWNSEIEADPTWI